jgi:hypothetical protein
MTAPLVELFVRQMEQPNRAMPELARFEALHRDTPAGDWAVAELAELRKRMVTEPRTSWT